MRNPDNTNRPRGVLTNRDRTYLRLSEPEREEEFSPSARTRARQDIQERVWNAFLDGKVLFNNLSKEERRQIFRGWQEFSEPHEAPVDENRPDSFADPAESRGKMVEKVRADRGFAGFLAFLYAGLEESGEFDFATSLEAAVRRAERSRGREVSAFDLTIESEPQPSVEELRNRFESRKELTTTQINRLHEAGEVSGDELSDYYNQLETFESETV